MNSRKYLKLCGALALLVTVVACGKDNPANPTALTAGPQTIAATAPGSFTDLKTGITLTSPSLVTPTAGQQFAYTDQPLTLTIKNAVSTGSTPLIYSFQVALDSGFTSLVYTKDSVAEGAGGQTKITIDVLPGPTAKNYFWRVRAHAGSVDGPYTAARGFGVGPQVMLQAPQAASPSQGTTVSGTLTLTVNDVGKTGPAGPITYQFDLSTSASFSPILFSQTVTEQSGQTSVAPTSNPGAGTYYWRVQAFDKQNGVNSSISTTFSFVYQPFDMSQASIVDSPFDLAKWAQTATITSVQFSGDESVFVTDFDLRDGPGRWPDVPFGDGGSLQYTLGMCLNINGHWYCSAAIQYWYGRDPAATTAIADSWFYDARWGTMQGYQPAWGETVGIFVGAGNLRDKPNGGGSYSIERSNVVFVPFGQSYNGPSRAPIAIKLSAPGRR